MFTPDTGQGNVTPNTAAGAPEIEVKELPSKFLPYPKGTKITYRPYLFGEVKKFNQGQQSTSQAWALIASGIKCSFDVNELTLSDLRYIGLLRKISTFGLRQ